MTLEKMLVEQCAPTLARIKTGSLFTVDCGSAEELHREAANCREILAPRDVHLELMRISGGRALVYVYRKKRLEMDLSCPLRREFLLSCGYEAFDAESAVSRLRARIEETGGFPHEIGLFLGYPLRDVEGFVENCGRNCLLCGPWKVYHDVPAAERAFAQLRKCTAVYRRLYGMGRPLERLTVPA